MFRGIDPDGLIYLARVVESRAIDIRHQTRSALDILSRNGHDIAIVATTMARIDHWGTTASTNLRWRADVIQHGQEVQFDVLGMRRAEFAAEAAFSIDNVDHTFRKWLTDRQDREQRVAGAVADISSWLDQGWLDWDVTNDDLHNISATLAALSGPELDQVIAELSPTQLKRWVQEMGHSINGLSRDEKRRVFDLLTINTTGTTLVRVHDAILAGGDGEDAIDLGMAIRTHSSEQTIVDFVTYTVGQDLSRHRYSGVAPALAVQAVKDPQAVDAITRAIITAGDALALIAVDSLITAHVEDTGNACIDIDPLASLITPISNGTDPALRAAAFTAMVRFTTDADGQLRALLDERHGIFDSTAHDFLGTTQEETPATDILNDTQEQFLAAATRLLASDANGVVAELATELDEDGALTTSYFRQLVDLGRSDGLHRVIIALRGGDTVDSARFAEYGTDPDYPYPHAQNLAFLAGGLSNALAAYAGEAKADIDAISMGAGLAIASVGPVAEGLSWAAATVTPMLGDGAINWFASNNVQGDIDEHRDELIEVVETHLQPLRTLGGPPVELGESGSWWDYRFRTIRRRS